MAKRKSSAPNGNGANLGFEEKLWAAADKLRGHMNAAEFKYVVLGGRVGDLSSYGQESNNMTWRLCKMNRGIDGNIGPHNADTLHNDVHKDLKADFILAKDAGKYADVAGFCKSASLEEITSHGFVLTPSRYVGAEETEDDDDMPFDERMEQLTAKLKSQFKESAKLEKAILANFASLGFTGKESS